jgi:hypothetical protein
LDATRGTLIRLLDEAQSKGILSTTGREDLARTDEVRKLIDTIVRTVLEKRPFPNDSEVRSQFDRAFQQHIRARGANGSDEIAMRADFEEYYKLAHGYGEDERCGSSEWQVRVAYPHRGALVFNTEASNTRSSAGPAGSSMATFTGVELYLLTNGNLLECTVSRMERWGTNYPGVSTQEHSKSVTRAGFELSVGEFLSRLSEQQMATLFFAMLHNTVRIGKWEPIRLQQGSGLS